MGYGTDGSVATGIVNKVIFDLKIPNGEIIKSYVVAVEDLSTFEKDLQLELPTIKSIHHVNDVQIVRRQFI
jgi:hypothetical protein